MLWTVKNFSHISTKYISKALNYRGDQVVDCGSSLDVWSCCLLAGYWNMLSRTSVLSVPNMHMQVSFPETFHLVYFFDRLCTTHEGEETECGGHGPGIGYTWSAVVRLRFDELPNSLKQHQRWFIGVKRKFSSQATGLMNSMPIACSLRHLRHCVIKLHIFSVPFNREQSKAHMCNYYIVYTQQSKQAYGNGYNPRNFKKVQLTKKAEILLNQSYSGCLLDIV